MEALAGFLVDEISQISVSTRNKEDYINLDSFGILT